MMVPPRGRTTDARTDGRRDRWTKIPEGPSPTPTPPTPEPSSQFRRPWGNDVNDASRCVDKPRCVCAVGIWDQISASHGVLPASQFTCKMLHNQVKSFL